MKYTENDDNPAIEVWRWVLVVPWWRVIFECKRHMIDLKEKEEEKIKAEQEIVKMLKSKEKDKEEKEPTSKPENMKIMDN
jgi:hypothetical protein